MMRINTHIKLLPIRSYLNVQGHLDIEEVLILSQIASHLLLCVIDIPLQIIHPHLDVNQNRVKTMELESAFQVTTPRAYD